jgi:hypothetical protein
MSNKEKLAALQQLASERYGVRLALQGQAFIIDGIRLFLTGDDWKTLCPARLLDRLGVILATEQAARKVSETA